MTADSLHDEDSESIPGWLYPPPEEGWSVDDLDRLPPAAPRRVELIDGSLILLSPASKFHSRVTHGLCNVLDGQAPSDLRADHAITIRMPPHRADPDVLLVSTAAYLRTNSQTFYNPSDVWMVVEVVSSDSVLRDRERKPQIYAQHGIEHFWRVENDNGRAVVYVYELDPATKTYALTGIFHDKLKVGVPFPIDIDLETLTA